jgi:pimeloyl-ACP methyl ester carboxylesterase
MEPRSRWVSGADGLRLHGIEWSDAGVPFLLLHGFGNDAHIWDDFAPVLAPYYRTLALDLRGHGDSDRDPEARYDYADHVRDLEALTRELAIERLVVLGHSLGGRVAMLFAGRHPERVAGLVVVDSGPELDPRGVVRIQVDMEKTGDASFSSVADYEAALARAYPAAAPSALARMARHGLRRREDGRFERKTDPAFHRRWAEADPNAAAAREQALSAAIWDSLKRTSCPSLVVRGAASDVLSADVADRMVEEALPNARLAVVARAGHSVMTDNPEGFSEAVEGFALADA